jgi:hypothetical protein
LTLDFNTVKDYLWATVFLVELAVCGLLFIRGYFRRLPFFTAYISLNLCQAVFLYAIHRCYGDGSAAGYIAAWLSEAITLAARLCATVEVLRLVLMSYRGLWGMTWRLLAFVCPLILFFVGVFSRPHPPVFVMQVDSGYHVVFAVALVLCLALLHYYPIRVEPVYKVLLSGFCWYSCAKIVINATLQGYSYSQNLQYWPIWQTLAISAYLLVLILWGSVLSNPLPAIQQRPALLPDSVYTDISPEINDQLQAINKRLTDFWKIKGPPQ